MVGHQRTESHDDKVPNRAACFALNQIFSTGRAPKWALNHVSKHFFHNTRATGGYLMILTDMTLH